MFYSVGVPELQNFRSMYSQEHLLMAHSYKNICNKQLDLLVFPRNLLLFGFGLSESYLDSSVSSDIDNLYIQDYKLVRADHPGKVKRGDVCIHFKKSLPVSCLSNPYLKECLIFEVSINNKRGYIVSIHQVKLPMILIHLPLIWRNLQLTYLVVICILY